MVGAPVHGLNHSKVTDINEISSALDSEAAMWSQVHWQLLEEQFLFWYLWLKDNVEFKLYLKPENQRMGTICPYPL